MKKLFLINHIPSINDVVEQAIAGWYMQELGISEPADALQAANLRVEKYVSNAELRAKYHDGLPEDAIAVLGPKLADGSSKLIFDLFGSTLKKRTIIAATDGSFGLEAVAEGFEHILTKDGKIRTFLDLQKTIIEWNKQ